MDLGTRSGWAAQRAAHFLLLAMVLLVSMTLGSWPSAADQGFTRDTLVIESEAGALTFRVEVAETHEQKARGLMFRSNLAPMAGMLFPYGVPQEITMWMRNTYIPLDMIFIRGDGTIHRIEAQTQPHSETIIASKGAATAVLEIAGGEAQRLGIKAGDKVRHRVFAPTPPAR